MQEGDLPKLTQKQKLFCKHYLSNGNNAVQAVMSAGYRTNEKVASTIGWENLGKPGIKAYIEVIMKEEVEKAGVGLQWRLGMIKNTVEACYDGRATKEGFINADGVYKGLDQLNKMDGSYAATETKVEVSEAKHDNVDGLIKQFEKAE